MSKQPKSSPPPASSKTSTFVAICLFCAAVWVGYLIYVKMRVTRVETKTVALPDAPAPAKTEPSAGPAAPVAAPAGPAAAPAAIPPARAPLPAPRLILYRSMATDANYGKLAIAPGHDPAHPRFHEKFSCESVHFAAGHGICLTADRGVFTAYTAYLFDAGFKRQFSIPLEGIPSRSRVSPDGRMAAATVFVTGHSYASADFSTLAQLYDTATGNLLADLEDFAITRDGKPFHAQDFNFWGVTFTPDSKRFYCTLSSSRKHYLVEADIASRRGKVIHENVECPSVSPDGKRVAYKKRFLVQDRVVWQLHVLDLATLAETSLAEKRTVDDQLEWLDNGNVLYALPDTDTGSSASTDVWVAAADGKSAPRLFLAKAYSPAVVR